MAKDRPVQVFLIEDEEYDVRRVRNTLRGFETRIQISEIASNGRVALDRLRAAPDAFDVVIMDFQIAGGLMGENLIREIKAVEPSIQIIVVTKMTVNVTDFEFANSLLSAGAFWYCTKYPGDIEAYIYQPTDFVLSIFNANQKRQLEKLHHTSTKKLEKNIDDILAAREIIGKSRAIVSLKAEVLQCASNDASVLISGFSGTGKEIVAYNIHYRSRRKFENFVPVNCGSLPHDLIESELFGYEKGSFTGADAPKSGLFEYADKGTLFLDEIGELPMSAQVKLLRVLQDGEIEKIGRSGKIKVDVRIIAATNKNLESEVREKRFREDLFYRLNVLPVYVPPLRERGGDIMELFDHYLSAYSADMGSEKPAVDPEAVRMLTAYSWPGNVRELKNVVQRLLLGGEEEITEWRLKEALGTKALISLKGGPGFMEFNGEDQILPLRQMERLVREKYFLFVREHSASDAEAAKKLGIAPPNYHRMCKEMGLK
jgi:two-component system, NtrC family, response regulator AtoC